MKYLKKIIAVVLAAGMIISNAPVAGSAANQNSRASKRTYNWYDKCADDIDENYTYEGSDLGIEATEDYTTFKIWAPSARYIKVNIYRKGVNDDDESSKVGSFTLEKMFANGNRDVWTGVWTVTLIGDWRGFYYNYTISTTNITGAHDTKYQVADPYSVAVSADGKRSYIIDPDMVSPDGWENDKHIYVDTAKANNVYKVSIKDFSTDTSSGTTSNGKYSAFTEKGATVNNAGELSSGIDYLKELGVTTVQLAPFSDYASDDEYVVANFNAPEPDYASDASNSKAIIKECKAMIQALHNAGISVVMEMPYTHTVTPTESVFEKVVPGYYYRHNTNGTYYTTTDYDNECATERAMYRKYVENSMKYWAEVYHIDGFSIDLVDCFDTKAYHSRLDKWLDEVKENVAKTDPRLVIWGDNYTKTDRQNKTSIYDNIISSINGSTYGARNEKAIKMYKQQAAMKYATPGILYMDAGEEMCSSVEGTTQQDKSVLEWQKCIDYTDVVSYYRGLMDIRKAFSPLADSQNISNNKEAYVLTNTTEGEWSTMAVLNNDTADDKEIAIPASREAADWVIIANGESAGLVSLGEVSGSTVKVPAYTTMILVDKESSLQVSVPEEKGRVIIDYLRTDGYGNSSFETPLRESITLYGTVGTGFVVPQNLNISSYYDLINAEYGKKGIFESGTIRLRYYYSAKYKPDRLVDGIINDGHYCEEVRFKVTDPAYTEVRVDDKKLTPDSNGYYTVSYADKEQTIKLIDNNGCNVQLYIKVLENHIPNNNDCTKDSVCTICGKVFPAQTSHKYSDSWSKDDTYHWKVCENDGCEVTSTKTEHSGTDDGDCTTPVICECGQIVTAAKAEHTYGEWKSNGDGTHTRKCTIQGCTAEETKDCEGGEATCTKKAVCTYCNSEYGALNPSNHSGSVEWVQTEGTHQKKYECCGAEYEAVESHKWENGHCSVCGYGCEHTGGEATCTEKAVCAICKLPYGKVDANNHTGTEEYIKTSTTHEKKYTCCGKVTLVKENHKWKDGVCEICDYKCVHTGGEANCTSGAICENCGMEYTDKEPSKHTGNPEWVQTEDTHKKAYDCCGLEVSAREEHIWEAGVCKICAYHCQHTGGEATCIQKAQCAICNEEYGTYNLGVHKGLKLVEGKAATKAEEGNIEYWYCEDCDRYYVEDNGYVEIQKADTVIAKIADNNNSNGAGSGDAGSNDTGAGSGDVGSNDTGAGSGDAGSNGTGAGSGDVGSNDTGADSGSDGVNDTATEVKETPDTADNNSIFVWLLMLSVGGMTVCMAISSKKRRTNG